MIKYANYKNIYFKYKRVTTSERQIEGNLYKLLIQFILKYDQNEKNSYSQLQN